MQSSYLLLISQGLLHKVAKGCDVTRFRRLKFFHNMCIQRAGKIIWKCLIAGKIKLGYMNIRKDFFEGKKFNF